MAATWRIKFNLGLSSLVRSGNAIPLESSNGAERVGVVVQTNVGPFEVVSEVDRLVVSYNSTRHQAKWSDEPPDWTRITATDMENWKYGNPSVVVALPKPANGSSSWSGMRLPAFLVFTLWNAWLKSAKQTE